MHCASCGYDLVGLPRGPCPECSRFFDPDDASSWVERPVSRWRALVRSRWSAYVAVSLVGVLAVWYTIIPRPYIAWNGKINPGLWIWFDRPFGIDQKNTMPETLQLVWWDGTLTRVRFKRADIHAPNPRLELTWDIRRHDNRWTLDVLKTDVRLDSVLLAYNSMRRDDELFGLQLDVPGADAAENPRAARRAALDFVNEKPFRVAGRQEDVLAAILVAYALDARPFLLSPDDDDVWVFDKDAGRLERLTVDEARQRGIECEVADSFRVRRHRFRQ